jgi:tetratricopeptide (TPR) repeat protein
MSDELSKIEVRVEKLRAVGAPTLELIDALHDLAYALQKINLQRCFDVSQEALGLSQQLNYPSGEARAYARIGWLYLLQGQIEQAFRCTLRAESLALISQDARLQCNALYISASIHQRINNVSFALRDWFKLLHTAQQIGAMACEADAYAALGILYREQEDFDEAIDCQKQALKRYVVLGDSNEFMALNNLAYAYALNGDGLNALIYARMALDRCPADWPTWRANFIHTIGHACLANGNTRLSLAQFESGIKLYQMARVTGQVNADSVIATLYQSAALALRKLGQFDQAAHKLDLALTEAERASDHPLQVEIHTDLASLMSLLGAKEMAQHHQARASALGHRLEHEQTVLRERVMDVFRAERNALPLAIGLAA